MINLTAAARRSTTMAIGFLLFHNLRYNYNAHLANGKWLSVLSYEQPQKIEYDYYVQYLR